jgi:hypothetical protein
MGEFLKYFFGFKLKKMDQKYVFFKENSFCLRLHITNNDLASFILLDKMPQFSDLSEEKGLGPQTSNY